MTLNIILRLAGHRVCQVCHVDKAGALMLPDGSHVCEDCALPALQALIVAKGPIGIVEEGEARP